MWVVDYRRIIAWLDGLDDEAVSHIFAALERLESDGPSIGRPLVDTLAGSTIKNLKELRPPSPGRTEIRIIFAFDPKRQAIMLLGGDKSKGKNGKAKWSGWYRKAIPQAEQIFRDHLRELGDDDGQSR